MHKGAKFRQIGDAKQVVCMIFLEKQSRRRQDMKTIIAEVKKKKINTSQQHVLYEEKSLIKISLIQDSSIEEKLFRLLPTLISTIVLIETFFDIKNSFKVTSSFAKVNFPLKTNTLEVSATEKVTTIIHRLTFNQN